MTAALAPEAADLIRTAVTAVVSYRHGAFFINGVEVDVHTAHQLRDLVFRGLLELHDTLVEATANGLAAAGIR